MALRPDQDPASRSVSERLRLVHDVINRLSDCADVAEAVVAIRTVVEEWLGADASIINLASEDDRQLTTLSVAGASDETESYLREPIEIDPDSPAGAVIATGRPIFWESLAERDRLYPRFKDFPSECPSWAILPLTARKRTFGTLSIGWQDHRPFGAERTAFLLLVAQQCALAIDRAYIQEAELADRRTLELMSEGTRLMVSDLDSDRVVQRLVHLAVPQLAPWCAVYVPEHDRLRRVAIEIAGDAGLAGQLRGLEAVGTDSTSPLAVCFRTGTPQLITKVGLEQLSVVYTQTQIDAIFRSGRDWTALVVPIRAAGDTIGVMSLVSDAWKGRPPEQVWHAAEGLAARAGVALANARRYGRERSTAALLSASLLPGRLPVVPGYRAAARYIPAQGRVAGDWFDVFATSKQDLLVGVGDVGGHDVRAATLMTQLRSAARGLALAGSPPVGLLSALTKLLLTEHPDEGFATALYGLLEPTSGEFRWASAGHFPPLAFSEGRAQWLDFANGPPLGLDGPSDVPVEHHHVLEPGAGLLLITDGVVERRDEDLVERLGEVADFVLDHATQPLEDLVDAIVARHCQDPDDDCCVVAIRRDPTGG